MSDHGWEKKLIWDFDEITIHVAGPLVVLLLLKLAAAAALPLWGPAPPKAIF